VTRVLQSAMVASDARPKQIQEMDWYRWHTLYQHSAPLKERLTLVRRQISACLTQCPSGKIRVISVCAGDGRDLLGAMAGHPRARDVAACLVERDPRLIEDGRAAASAAGLDGNMEFRHDDAAVSSSYDGFAPAQLVILCGMLGLVSQAETPRLVRSLALLCEGGGFVIWSRNLNFRAGRRHADMFIRLMGEAGFDALRSETTSGKRLFRPPPQAQFTVGTHLYRGASRPADGPQVLFEISQPELDLPPHAGGLERTTTTFGVDGASEVSDEISRLIEFARAELHAGRPEKAGEAMREVVAAHGENPDAWFLLGLTQIQAEKWNEALETLEQAAAIRSANPEILFHLGQAYRKCGRHDDALRALRRAYELNPLAAETAAELGATEFVTGAPKEGIAHLRRAARLALRDRWRLLRLSVTLASAPLRGFIHWLATPRLPLQAVIAMRRARDCARANEVSRAAKHYARAIALAPLDPAPYSGLARLRNCHGEHRLALDACNKAAEVGADDERVRVERVYALYGLAQYEQAVAAAEELGETHSVAAIRAQAFALSRTGRIQEALEKFQSVIQDNPSDADASYGIARCHEALGRFADAKPWLLRAIDNDRANAVAWLSLTKNGQIALDSPEFQRLAAILDDPHNPPAVRSGLRFAAAYVYERARRYDDAFAHFLCGNRLRDVSFSAKHHDGDIDALMVAFDGAFFERVSGWGNPSDIPVFILGLPRSGTTLVEQIVASHPRVFGAGELDAFSHIADRMSTTLEPREPYPACMARLDQETVGRLAGEHLAMLRRLAPEASRITDKMPGNYLRIGLITALFPKARIVHCRRDPMDTCLSIFCQSFLGGHPYAYDLTNLGRYYRAYQRLMDHWRRVLPTAMLEIDYEETVADPEAISRRLLEFCGLEWDERCLRFYESERAVHTASYAQVRRPVYSTSVHKWKTYGAYLAPLKAALAGD
jgi:tetratricopeptide (TPR) repeat protein